MAVSGSGTVGVLEVSSSTVTISGLTIENGAGGIFNSGGSLPINSSTMSGNTGIQGGGVLNTGTMTINYSTVSNNSSSDLVGAGGIFNAGGTMTVNSSTVSGNTTFASASGGIFNNGTMTVNSSTVSDNIGSHGGGVWNGGTMTVNSSTVSDNTGEASGGGIENVGVATLGATIVAANSSSTGGNCDGSTTSAGYNLTDDATGTACGFTQPTDTVDANPDLGPLGANGGPTNTLLPAASSPAIGVIPPNTALGGVQVCPRTDQRGVGSSPEANCAIGAVEPTIIVNDPGTQASFANTPIAPLANSAIDRQSGAGLTWAATGLPGGLAIDSTTGTVTGTPVAACSCSVIVSATDAAGYRGSAPFTWSVTNRAPVAGSVLTATPDGGGYWIAGADGGVFSYGNATFHGSLVGSVTLNAPITGIASTPDGRATGW
jgi:Putative Ig domain